MSRIGALLSCGLVAILGACDKGPPATSAASPAQIGAEPVTQVVIDGGATASAAPTEVAAEDSPDPATPTDGGPSFTSCSVDSDCVAVARVGCCKNGWMTSVNKQSVDAYNASFVCEKKRRICPQYRIVDRRQPICVNESHTCQMLAPTQVTCGGGGPNPHKCGAGTRCDATGHCAAPAAPTVPSTP
jgi:hypothetical protein